MSTTVTFKLNKPASQFAAGESQGFGIRGGVKYYDRTSKKDEWTNYEAAIFARSPAQIDFYAGNLVEGAVVTVSCETLKPHLHSQNNDQITLQMNNARLDYIVSPNKRAPDAAQHAYSRGLAPRAQDRLPDPAKPAGFDQFDDDLPW